MISGAADAIDQLEARWQEQDRKTKRLQVSHAFHSPLIEPMLDGFSEVVSSLDLNAPNLPVISNTSGDQLTGAQATDPAYWVSHARQPVRFADAVSTLKDQGATTYLELGPDAVLTAMAAGTLAEDESAALIPTLREGREEARSIALAFGSAHASGAKVDWETFFEGADAGAVDLPTYPFQRRRFWLDAAPAAGDLGAAGLTGTGHPLLSAAIEDPGGEGLTLSGRLSVQSHPWLADHIIFGTPILPGTAFLELALEAARRVGCEAVVELALQSPLVIPESDGVQLRVTVGGADHGEERDIAVHSRREGGEEGDGAWVCHAMGTLGNHAAPLAEAPESWPPAGAEPVEIGPLYERLAADGFEYGPAFQKTRAAWRRGNEVFAELLAPDRESGAAADFGIHPILLDSAFHAALVVALDHEGESDKLDLPFTWNGARVASSGAATMRVRIEVGEKRFEVSGFDADGGAVIGIEALVTRTLAREQVRGRGGRKTLHRLEWAEVFLPAAGEPAPDLVVVPFESDSEAGRSPADLANEAAQRALEQAQEWISADPPQGSRLVFVTRGALATGAEDELKLELAPLAGLLRSAHSEYPDRFALVDLDGTDESERALDAALALTAEEPELALRGGRALARRLSATEAGAGSVAAPFDAARTVLVTGGTGGIGALLARHLVSEHGVRHLLLVSRRGPEVPGVAELEAELHELGAEQVTVAACDVADRDRLEQLFDSIPAEHPLGAVIHSAGALDDCLLSALDAERLRQVMRPKVDAAWHLHELTAAMDLSQFVMFSSAAGLLGGSSQANYSAANAFLDGLAAQRRRQGLPGLSLAWGLWDHESGMSEELTAAQGADFKSRVRARLGFIPLASGVGLELFDAALAQGDPLLAPVEFDAAALGARAKAGALPPVLRGLVRAPVRPAAATGTLAAQLDGLPESEREAAVLSLVRSHVAAALGHDSPGSIPPERAFKELGFDSLSAVELRNRLGDAIGVRLPATIAFDHPSIQALAKFVLGLGEGSGRRAPTVVRRANAALDEPIAIVGMSCRLPGGVGSPGQLWQLLAEGRDAIAPFPDDRGWDLERLYDPDPNQHGTSYAREGGFIDRPADFDADFFGISPREALAIDPQQRVLLESCWEALEDAGIDPGGLHGGQAGVFAGVMYHDYGVAFPLPGELEGNMTRVSSGSFVAGRVAYTLGLEGPAMSVDTACSSSLVTIHLACQSLRQGECPIALAGGISILSTPGIYIEFSRARGLSPDGRCKSFSEAADGTGFSEGVGMLVLERLSEAEAKGHTVLATIRGSAVNQDGASNGLTAPSGPSQERVIRQALANARLESKDIEVIEAHGTGTALGDPIEASALLATYGQDRETPARLGSVKSNLGHTQAAAGVSAVIKTVLAMREGVMPKTLHVDAPSSKVEWEAGEIELLTEAAEWKPNGHPRRAGVSSFGASGTNAHLILEEAPVAGRDPGPGTSSKDRDGEEGASSVPLAGPVPLVLSAKSAEALRESASRLATYLEQRPDLDPTDLSFSLATTRAQLEQRGVVIGEECEELLSGLSALSKGEPTPNAHTAKATSGRLAYLFTGQGSQRPGMGKQLYETYPAYAEALDDACNEIDKHIDRSLEQLIFSEPGSKDAKLLDHTTYAQPALFATELALHRLFESIGLTPDLLTGHSVGEITAAHIAGVFSLEDAAKLISARGKLMGELPEGGAMLAIEATEPETLESIEGREAELSLAAVNGPKACVISGDEKAIDQLETRWQEQDRKTKRLQVSHAFHSPLIEPMLDGFSEVVSSLDLNAPNLPVISNTSGDQLTGAQATDPAYWVSHARQPVRFADAVATLKEQSATTYLELGPDAVLTAMAAGTLADDENAALIPTLREGRDEPRSIALAFGSAHASGAKVDWDVYFKGTGAKAVPLPTYPFQRKRYWLDTSAGSADLGAAGITETGHPILTAAIEDPEREGLTLTGRISLQSHPWLADHAVAGTVLLPGTALVEMALRAGREIGCEQLAELTLRDPLLLPEQAGVAIRVSVAAPGERGEREVTIHSRAEAILGEEPAEWTCHARGVLAPESPAAVEPASSWPPAGAEPIELDSAYERFAELGFDYGPAFQGLTAAWRLGEEIYTEVSLAEAQAPEAARFGIHPALLDPVLQGGLLGPFAGEEPKIPFAWTDVALHGSGAGELRVRIVPGGPDRASFEIADGDGLPLARIGQLSVRAIPAEQLRASTAARASTAGAPYLPRWDEVPGDAAAGDGASTRLLEPAELDLGSGDDPAATALAACQSALALIQRWLGEEQPAADRLVLLTKGAFPVAAGEAPDLVAAALSGIFRSAASEHPGRFAAIDGDGSEESATALATALAIGAAEPQLALRGGRLLAPRLAPAKAGPAATEVRPIDPDRTVLITGGLSGIGALVARHLVEAHGARHLLLVSRRGGESEGAAELRAALEELGAEVAVAACDVSDRARLEQLFESVDPAHPLGAIVHSAGLLDDGLIEALDPERMRRVFAPKVDAAWHLHELSREMDLSQFLLFSSAAGLVGGAAQANYAAANGFLDALCQHRRATGLPATALAWGVWEQGSGAITGTTAAADMDHLLEQVRSRLGFVPMPAAQGLALFDAARALGEPLVAPAPLDATALRALAAAGTLPPLLRELTAAPPRRRGAEGSLAKGLAAIPAAEREARVLELVRTHTAGVLGHDSAAEVAVGRSFKELGFDSLAAVELRNRLGVATGLRLAPTVIFDYPNAKELSGHLLGELRGSSGSRVAVRAQASEEPIAIVGMACRLPGGVGSPRELWALLEDGRDAIEPFPTDRGWDLERLYDPDPDRPGTAYAREGGFLEGAADFDAGFFAISPREALSADPQQRLLLEASWEALEDAGIDPFALRGSATGVFAGAMYPDYRPEENGITMGTTGSVVSGRVAYTLGLEGPAISVDTACSSSLVSMHLASQALRGGECELALAGGVTVLATPGIFIEFSRQRGLAGDGRCKAFSEQADGTGFAEGVGMLVLERLSAAEANGHDVLAVIRGSAVNQDGASNGLTAPNGPSQERVIRQALANARLEPGDIDLVEAHGTGTALGDPIEAGALLATYGQERAGPLRLGTVKSNIGHTQAAAGAAGVIKAVLAMREGVMPKTLHVDAPSSKVDWGSGEIELLTEAAEWRPGGRPRRAGVSSFGASGTNAHLILEEAPPAGHDRGAVVGAGDAPAPPLAGALPFPLSAKSPGALTDSVLRLAAHLEQNPELELGDVSFSLAATRAQMEQRATVIAGDREELLAGLGGLIRGENGPSVVRGAAEEPAKAAFLFPGQGSQHARMGAGLLESSPVFRAHMQSCEEALEPFVDWSLRDVLADPEGAWLDRLEVVQPALFAVMVSLARLWEEFGVRPAAVLGHSQGEIAAAHIAGGLDLDDAARVVALRARAVGALAGKGAMVSLSLPVDELPSLIEPYGERVSLAAINGPASLVLAGEPEALDRLLERCERDGVRCQRIAVDYAAHSAQVEALRGELLEAFAPISPRHGEISFYSTVTGRAIDTAELDAEHWYRNLREPVLFEPALRGLVEGRHCAAIEVSPHPVLAVSAAAVIEASGAPAGTEAIASLRRDEQGPEHFLAALAKAHAAGVEVEWGAFFKGSGARAVPLPTYPFQRKRFWPAQPPGGRAAGDSDEHPLLWATIEHPGSGMVTLTGRISLRSHAWLADHAFSDAVLLPGTAFLEIARQAARQVGLETIAELTLQAPLLLPPSDEVELQVVVEAAGEDGTRQLAIYARGAAASGEGAGWVRHAAGALSPLAPAGAESLATWPPPAAEPVELDSIYERLAAAGFEYGPAFQGLAAAWRLGKDVYAEVAPQAVDGWARGYGIQPAMLDAAFHLTLRDRLERSEGGAAELPFSWGGVSLYAKGDGSEGLRVRVRDLGEEISVLVADRSGAALAAIDSLVMRPLPPERLAAAGAGTERSELLELEWVEVPLERGIATPRIATLAGLDLPGVESYGSLEEIRAAVTAGAALPDAVAVALPLGPAAELPGAAAELARAALELAQEWLALEGFEASRLVLVTENAVTAGATESPQLAAAPLWGLLRAARTENPDRFALVDSDGSATSRYLLAAALAGGEAELALRDGVALAPRVTPVLTAQASGAPQGFDPERTVLISGGTGALGSVVAEHLVAEHGVRHLLLAGRSGVAAEGAEALAARLTDAGAEVRIESCDLADREAVEALLSSISAEHPLGAIVHAAGVLADRTVESLDAELLERVFAPKVDAAWNLHELTLDAELSAFVLFSSIAGGVGYAGQANYAAANTFLDALAARRRAEGLPATSIAWGVWEAQGEMGSELEAADFARIRRTGVATLSVGQGLALFDQALAADRAAPLAASLDRAALRAQASAGLLPPVLRGLVRVPTRGSGGAPASLASRLTALSAGEREVYLLDLVRTEVAAVLGHQASGEIDPDRAFKKLGFDSLAAVDLRNRVTAMTGVKLPATTVFDYPTSKKLAERVLEVAGTSTGSEPEPLPEDGLDLSSASDEEMFELLDRKLGRT